MRLDVFPKYYRHLTMDTELTGTKEHEGGQGPQSKISKKTITNDKPNDLWTLRDGECMKTFQDAPGRDKPMKVCLKYWINNECDSGCRKKKSHHALTDKQKSDMNTFMKSMRKEK